MTITQLKHRKQDLELAIKRLGCDGYEKELAYNKELEKVNRQIKKQEIKTVLDYKENKGRELK